MKLRKFTYVCFFIFLSLLFTACNIKGKMAETIETDSYEPLKFEQKKFPKKDLTMRELTQIAEEKSGRFDYLEDTNILQDIDVEFSSREVCDPIDALLVLFEVRTLMNIQDFSFSLVREDSRYYWFKQLYKGLPVFQGDFYVGLSGITVNHIKGKYIADIDLEDTTGIPEEDAKKLITGEKILQQELMVCDKNLCKNQLVWKFVIQNPVSKRITSVLFDAKTGDFVREYSLTSNPYGYNSSPPIY